MLFKDFIKPAYEGNCFSQIPGMIQPLLTGEGPLPLRHTIFKGLEGPYETVILCLVDAFGWQFFDRFRYRLPFFRHFHTDGRILQMDAQFPSTTACHVTTIHTGLPVGQSNVFDWQYYEPELDTIIAPLLFSMAGVHARENLRSTGIKPEAIIPTQTLYQELARAGISSHVFQHKAFTPSTFSDVVFRGATPHPYRTLPEALVNMETILERSAGPRYLFFYFSAIDDICHHYGPQSRQFEAEVEAFFSVMEQRFFGRQPENRKKTLLIITADHGQVAVDPETTIYLNLDPAFAGFETYIRRNKNGQLLIPGGSSRNMIIYLKTGTLDDARSFLSERLEGRADVIAVSDLINDGFFGPWPPHPGFVERAGDLMILPHGNESVWWYEKGRFEQRFLGHHGGLTPEEVQIPFLLYPF